MRKINIVKENIDGTDYFMLKCEPIKYGYVDKEEFQLMTDEEYKQLEKKIEEREKRSISVDLYLNEPINKKG